MIATGAVSTGTNQTNEHSGCSLIGVAVGLGEVCRSPVTHAVSY